MLSLALVDTPGSAGEEWPEIAKLVAGDGTVGLGSAVALSGDTALVGAPNDDDNGPGAGAAYVFVRSAGIWTEQAKLLASDGAAAEQFGRSVALSGDTALVGSGPETGAQQAGPAYVFVRSGGRWAEQAILQPREGIEDTFFGRSVALSGNLALIGAPTDAPSGMGAAYVFVRSGSAWSEEAALESGEPLPDNIFGASVALSGDFALVGAPGDNEQAEDAGAGYVFFRSGLGTWTQEAKLVAGDGEIFDALGMAVALSDDTAVLATFMKDNNAGFDGGAYVFENVNDEWMERIKLVPGDSSKDHLFGSSVAASNELIVVGAVGDDDNGTFAGAAYVFARSEAGWDEQAKLLPGDGSEDDFFGASVSVSDATALIGAPAGSAKGAAYLFGLPILFADGFESGDTSAWSTAVP